MPKIPSNIKIELPILKSDFEELIKIVSENLVFDKNLTEEYFQSMSSGEILLAWENTKLVGAIVARRPGKIFSELKDGHFDLENIKFHKKDLGYVAIVVVDKDCQGKGIGKILLKEALKYQKHFGSKAVITHCWQSSPGHGSQKLFTSFGFEPLKVHKRPWYEYAKKVGSQGHQCIVCGNPCACDELEMVKYL